MISFGEVSEPYMNLISSSKNDLWQVWLKMAGLVVPENKLTMWKFTEGWVDQQNTRLTHEWKISLKPLIFQLTMTIWDILKEG